MSNDSTLSFDRMRGMLVRAAEIRDSEQQQIFDSLDEIHARLAGLDQLGPVRKRLTELPDRTEVGVAHGTDQDVRPRSRQPLHHRAPPGLPNQLDPPLELAPAGAHARLALEPQQHGIEIPGITGRGKLCLERDRTGRPRTTTARLRLVRG